MSKETIKLPDVGTDQAEVIEICVAVGDEIAAEDSLVVLESEKASMELPAPKAGKVTAILVENGQTVSEGDPIVELDVASDGAADTTESDASEKAGIERENTEKESTKKDSAEDDAASEAHSTAQETANDVADAGSDEAREETVPVPDIGTEDAVEVIEVCVAEGDEIGEGDSMIVLESDKASMEVPAPSAGTVSALSVKVGDSVRQGDAILTMKVSGSAEPRKTPEKASPGSEAPAQPAPPEAEPPKAAPSREAPSREAPSREAPSKAAPSKAQPELAPEGAQPSATAVTGGKIYAGPAVRKLAREFSINLASVTGSGPKGRILKEDLQAYVKQMVENKAPLATGGAGIPAVPEVDFAAFGDVVVEPMSKMHKLTATNMHRSWLNVPHVTQFDDADVTDLETFRKSLKAEAEQKGVKMTPLPFLLKACAAALQANPRFNASLAADGEHLVYKHYVHIGIAVDTPAGLMVPVIRDVDKKSLWQLAAESAELAAKAKERKLKPQEMQGGCFSISSLGNIGGQGFTPIVNTPEVAILGVSKLSTKPVWNGSEFEPRQMLPLSLSYDHRVVNGADAGRFFTFLNDALADIRRLLL